MEQLQRKKRNPMATASLILGALSIVSIVTIVYANYAYFLACMSILFAVLSKGSGTKMPEKSVGGLVTSIIALVLVTVLMIVSFLILISMFGLETVMDPEALLKAATDFLTELSNELPAGGNAL